MPGSFRASVNSRLSIRGSQGNHTIFGCFRFALLRHPSCVGVSARSTSLPTRNLRLLFRPVRTGIFTPASNRRTAAIRHHPPTHKRTDERTEISPWHSLICRRGQVCRRLPLSTPPGTWLLQWHLTAHSLCRSHPKSSPPPSIFGRGSDALHFG